MTVAQQCVLVDATELYVYLKMIKMVNFVLHIFHYNLKKMKEIIAMGNFFSDRLKKKKPEQSSSSLLTAVMGWECDGSGEWSTVSTGFTWPF